MLKTKAFPRFMVCATSSGSGKTLITCALLRILVRNGFLPASFKCGPDYIDPMFHSKVLGIPSRNLDVFLMGSFELKKALCRGADGRNIGVMEGVMGFFDGMSAASSDGSSYDISCMTGTPAILVADCRGMSRSVIPLVKGFCDYDRKKIIRGIILNNISPMVAEDIKRDIEKEVGVPVIGLLPKLKDVGIDAGFESRHLGLIMPDEIPMLLKAIDNVADKLLDNLDLDKLLQIAKETEDILSLDDLDSETEPLKHSSLSGKVRVGVARDEAFCFYYQDNLDLMEEMGAELVPFSPIHDEKLPDVSRILFGGGYPELYAKALSENKSMREDILKASERGIPILAECGGFLYLQESLSDPSGNSFDMVGALSGHGKMRSRLHHFGYVTMRSELENPYLHKDEEIKAHEFHYYDTSENGYVCSLTKPSGTTWNGYQIKENTFGGFAHLYYPSNPEFLKRFMEC